MDIHDIAPDAIPDSAGYWRISEDVEVSYPEEGNEFCAGVEEESFWFAHRNRAIVVAAKRFPPVGGPILDVGAGNGFVTVGLVKAGFPTIAIEPSGAGAALAVKRGLSVVLRGTLPSPAVAREIAGAIGLFDVIEHVQNDVEWLSSLREYLKSGGRIYITTPAYAWLWSAIDEQSGHYRRYSLRSLRHLVTQAGFSVEFATYIFWCLPPAIFLARRLRRGTPPDRGEHTIGGAWSRALARSLFGWEIGAIASGVSVPIGGSCLLVARRAI